LDQPHEAMKTASHAIVFLTAEEDQLKSMVSFHFNF